MATFVEVSKDELSCSICLNIYTDPVSLVCGHSYCFKCIGDYLVNQASTTGLYRCPKCRHEFQERPALHQNIDLRNIADKVRAQAAQKGTGVPCTYCVHSPVPAVKSCLNCEAALCDNHLRVHIKSPEHLLTGPTTSPQNHKCTTHQRILEYYCAEDASCICVLCRLDEHLGHKVELLTEACEKKLEILSETAEILRLQTEETEKRLQKLQERKERTQETVISENERFATLFTDIRKQLEELQERVQLQISSQAEKILSSVSDMIQQLDSKKNELYAKIISIDEICNITNPVTFLQQPNIDCDNNEGKSEDDVDDLNGDLTSQTILKELTGILTKTETLCTGILNTQIDPETLYTAESDIQPTSDMLPAEFSEPLVVQEPEAACNGVSDTEAIPENETRITCGPQTLSNAPATSCLQLDENTAGNKILISEDLKSMSSTRTIHNRPEMSQRFQHSQVLSVEWFTSGEHCWDIESSRDGDWRVGVAYDRIKTGDHSFIGNNKESWCLRRCSKIYSVRHDNKSHILNHQPSSNIIRVYLNYEDGTLVFYELGDQFHLLYTFTTKFTRPLYAAFHVSEDEDRRECKLKILA